MSEQFIILQGDCIDKMKRIENESIDLVVTSPPYNANKKYSLYEDSLSVEEYKQFAKDWTTEVRRILKPNGSFWLNVGYMKVGKNQTFPLTYLYYDIVDMPLIQEIVWHYEGGMSYKKRFTHRTERWQWYCKNPNNTTFNLDDIRDISLNRTKDKRNHPLGKNPTDYWYFDRVVSGTGKVKDKTDHPCQFPVDMVERIIKGCSNKGDTILDCFLGSGTSGLATKNIGNRNFIGIELDEHYCEVAKNRIGITSTETSA